MDFCIDVWCEGMTEAAFRQVSRTLPQSWMSDFHHQRQLFFPEKNTKSQQNFKIYLNNILVAHHNTIKNVRLLSTLTLFRVNFFVDFSHIMAQDISLSQESIRIISELEVGLQVNIMNTSD
jgi:hypothetical protein